MTTITIHHPVFRQSYTIGAHVWRHMPRRIRWAFREGDGGFPAAPFDRWSRFIDGIAVSGADRRAADARADAERARMAAIVSRDQWAREAGEYILPYVLFHGRAAAAHDIHAALLDLHIALADITIPPAYGPSREEIAAYEAQRDAAYAAAAEATAQAREVIGAALNAAANAAVTPVAVIGRLPASAARESMLVLAEEAAVDLALAAAAGAVPAALREAGAIGLIEYWIEHRGSVARAIDAAVDASGE